MYLKLEKVLYLENIRPPKYEHSKIKQIFAYFV